MQEKLLYIGVPINPSNLSRRFERLSSNEMWMMDKGENRFSKLLNKLGVNHILAAPQHPQTIGKIESFHRNIQRELLKQQHVSNLEEEVKAKMEAFKRREKKRKSFKITEPKPTKNNSKGVSMPAYLVDEDETIAGFVKSFIEIKL